MLLLDIVTATSQEIIENRFNATNIRMFEARNNKKWRLINVYKIQHLNTAHIFI